MKFQFYLWLIFSVVIVSSAQNRSDKSLPDPHKHVVAVHQDPWKTDLAPEARIETLEGSVVAARDSVLSPNGQWLAFVFSTHNEWARVGLEDRRSGELYQLVDLPLEHRPINDIVWIDSTHLAFDRWSQPHYGMHYVIDIERTRLVLAAPFPDEFFLRQQRDTVR